MEEKRATMEILRGNESQTKRKKEIFLISSLVEIGRSQPAG